MLSKEDNELRCRVGPGTPTGALLRHYWVPLLFDWELETDLEDEREAFGGDAWPFGLAANQHVLEKFIGYCYQQGIAARQLAPQDLFLPSTWELAD